MVYLKAQCPQNTTPGSTINIFDWRTEGFSFYLKDEFQQVYVAEVTSPFYLSNYHAQFNTDFFAQTLNPDFQPEDGWELLFYDFGTPLEGVANPAFALYNRYSGMIRMFMYLSANHEYTYSEAFINTYFSRVGEVFYNSALLENQNAILNAIDNFQKEIVLNSVNRYNESYGTWIVSEWATQYDPCTCNITGELTFEPILQNISSVSLKLNGQSQTVPVYSTGSSSNSGNIRASIGRISDDSKKILGAYKKGNEIYKNVQNFLNTNEDPSNNNNAPKIAENLAQAILGVGTGNPIAVVAGLLTAATKFIGISQKKNIVSYNSTHSFTGTGEISTQAPYQAIQLYVPGSNHNNLPDARVPVYDNVLGVATLLETPEIYYFEDEEIREYPDNPRENTSQRVRFYQLASDLKYAINGNAGIDEIPDNIKVALYFDIEWDETQKPSTLPAFQGLKYVNDRKLRTPYMNPSCLKNYPIFFSIENSDFGGDPNAYKFDIKNVYIAIAMILNQSNSTNSEFTCSNKIAYFQSYKVKLIADHNYNWQNHPSNPYLNVPEDLTINYNDIDANTRTWGITRVVGAPTPPPFPVYNSDTCGMNLEKIPKMVIVNGLPTLQYAYNYNTDAYTISCGNDLPVGEVFLANFCNSSKYDPIVTALKNQSGHTDLTKEKTELISYPNPVSNNLYLNISCKSCEYKIISSNGELIKHGLLQGRSINCSDLSSGLYFIIVYNNKTISYGKFIKI